MKTRPIHFSTLKAMAESAAHYALACTQEREQTRAMRVGTALHQITLLGTQPVLWSRGDRRGKVWDEFEAQHAGALIVTVPELDDAMAMADALARDAEAQKWLEGRHEVPVVWEMFGETFQTRGIDVLGVAHVADLKSASSTRPDKLRRQCDELYYYAQLAAYDEAARSLGVEPKDHMLVCVASAAPHNVTCLKLTPAQLEKGKRLLRLWVERVRLCEDSGVWPGYAQSAVDYDVSSYELED